MIRRHRQGHRRVQPFPAGEGDQRDPDDDARRCDHIGHEVPGVGLQRDGAVPPARPAQPHRHPEVDERGEAGHPEAEPRLLDRLGVQQAVHGGVGAGRRRDDDQRPLDAAGEVLRLGMAVGVLLVHLLARHGQGDQRDDGRDEVNTDSRASESSPTEPVRRYAPAFRPMVTTAAAMGSHAKRVRAGLRMGGGEQFKRDADRRATPDHGQHRFSGTTTVATGCATSMA